MNKKLKIKIIICYLKVKLVPQLIFLKKRNINYIKKWLDLNVNIFNVIKCYFYYLQNLL